jgi:hypothetical protein
VSRGTKKLFEEFNRFNRDLLTRFDRSWAAIDRRLDAQTDVLLKMRREVEENTAAIADMRESIQANTQAVLHVLDELRGPGPAQA